MKIRHIYSDSDSHEIELSCPWAAQSGNIPPPVIDFHTTTGERSFAYKRTEYAT